MVAESRPRSRTLSPRIGLLVVAAVVTAWAVPALATDYNLVAPASMKSASKLVVVDPSGKLAAGDRVVGVTFGGGSGSGSSCAVWEGDGPSKATELAAAGSAGGFAGTIVTGDCKPPRNAAKGMLVVAGEAVDSRASGKAAGNKNLLTWVALAAGGVLVVGALWRLLSRGSGPSDPVTVKGIERRLDALRDQMKRLEDKRPEEPKEPAWAGALRNKVDAVEKVLEQIQTQPDIQPLLEPIAAVAANAKSMKGQADAAAAVVAEMRESAELLARQAADMPDLAALNASLASMGRALEALIERQAERIDLRPEVAGLQSSLEALSAQFSETSRPQAEPVDTRPEIAALQTSLDVLTAQFNEASQRQAEPVDLRPEIAALQTSLEALSAQFNEASQRQAEPVDLRPEIAALQTSLEALSAQFNEASQRQVEPVDLRPEIAELRASIEALTKGLEALDLRQEVAALRAEMPPQVDWQPINEQLAELRTASEAERQRLSARLDNLSEQRNNELDSRFAELASAHEQVKSAVEALQAAPDQEALNEQFHRIEASIADIAALVARQSEPEEASTAIQAALESLSAEVAATGSRVDSLAESTGSDLKSGGERLAELANRFETELEAVRSLVDPLVARFGDDRWLQDLRTDVEGQLDGLREKMVELASQPVGAHDVTNATLQEIEERLASVTRRAEETEAAIAEMNSQIAGAPQAPALDRGWGDVLYSADAMGALAEPKPEPEPEVEPYKPAEPAKVSFDLDVDLVSEEEPTLDLEDEGAPGPERDRLPWSCVGGSSERCASRVSRRPLRIESFVKAIRPLTPTDTPDSSCSVGALLYAHGSVVFSHGAYIRGFWPSRERKTFELPLPIPGVAWRLAANHDCLYATLEDRVVMIRLSDWKRQGEFAGAYHNQVCNGTIWAGLTQVDGQGALDVRSPGGRQFAAPVALPFDAIDCVALAASGDTLFAASSSGQVCRLKAGTEKASAFDLGPDRQLLHLCIQDRSLVAVTQSQDGVRVQVTDFRNKKRRDGNLGNIQVGHCPVVMGGALYVVDQSNGGVLVCDLKNLDAEPTRIAPDLRVVRSMCGVEHGDDKRLLAIAGDDAPRKGRALVLDATTGEELTLCTISSRVHAEIVPADGCVAVATCTTYQNVIQVFDPFVAAEVGEDQAA